MISCLSGKIKEIKEKSVIIFVNGLGFELQTPNTKNLIKEKNIEMHTYLHWNQEKGPSLYGFIEELEKKVFLLIIGCPKIGPGIAIKILSQINASKFIEIISSQNQDALSSINGIGPKKAEQIIMFLKNKVSKLITSGELNANTQQDFVQWQNVNDVLISLNYSKPEIAKTMQYLTEKHSGQNIPLDQLIRSALGYLSGNL
ncbi:Holliday junction branch migration protein RuvA [Candidatus Dependentiae bacterium]